MLAVAVVGAVSGCYEEGNCDGCGGGSVTFRFTRPIDDDYVFHARRGTWTFTLACDAAARAEPKHFEGPGQVSAAECVANGVVAHFTNCGAPDVSLKQREVELDVVLVVAAPEGLVPWSGRVVSTRVERVEVCGTVSGVHDVTVVRR